LDMDVVAFSPSIFLADDVLALLLVPLRGECGATSFFEMVCTPLEGIAIIDVLSKPFSRRGEVGPFAMGLVGPSLASSTIKSWSLFSASLICVHTHTHTEWYR